MKQTKNIALIAAAVVIIILLLRYCKSNPVEIREIVTVDTFWHIVKADTQYVPKIVNHYLPGKSPKPFEKWDTLYLEQLPEDIDTAKILEQFFSFNTYSDTLKNKYGYVLVEDTVMGNMIMGRGVKTDLKVPEVTKTITRTIIEKKNQLYVGAALFGNPKELAAGYEFNLSLKTKNDRILEAGYLQEFSGIGYFKIGYRHKLSFKKQ